MSARRALPAIRRVVAALPAIRRQLLAAERTATVLHGDAHPGNVLSNVLTRLGSPLEDVSAWLQALGYRGPEM